jgi:carboxypeptidase family protein/immune inhibitor InhA-like protein/flagellar hook capping protein FlgD
MKKMLVIMIVSFLIFGLTLNADSKEKTDVRDLTGLAPRQLTNIVDNHQVTASYVSRDPEYQVYAFNAYDPSAVVPVGPVTFVLNDPAGLTSLAAGTSADFIAAATMIEDTWISCEYGTGNFYTVGFDGTMTLIGGNGTACNGLAYDDNSGILYGATYGATSDLYTIDPATGEGTLIGTINTGIIIAMGCDNAGNLYGTDIVDSNLYSIDPATGAGTIIGPLGITISYAQDAEYDKDDEVFYLSAYTAAGELYTCDTATGATTFIGAFPGGMEVTGFAIPYTLAEDGAPAEPSDVVVTPDAGGALSCEISWVCPDLTYAGDTLTELLEMRIYRDGVLVYTDSSPTIGGAGSYEDFPTEPGMYIYDVVGYNSEGEGPGVGAEVWIGEDIPNAVTDLTLTDMSTDELIAQLDWVNPTTGFHGGYFTGVAGYDIERSDGELFSLAGSMTSWQDDTIVNPGVYSYTVSPFNGSGYGPSTTSAQVGIGVSIVQVGTQEIGDYQVPINLFYMDSMVEVVYLQEWIGSDMLINTVSFHAATTSPMTDACNLEIWMGETTETDLSAGWIDGNSMVQTFAGTLDVPPGDSWIDIPLDSAFEYTYSGNLVMMIIRDDDEYYSTADLWWCTESNTAFRTRLDYNDDGAAQHFNALTGPFTSTQEKTIYPDVRFYYSPLEHGDVEGVVTNSATSNPVDGAEVYVGAFGPATTNASGEYMIEDVVIGVHEVTAMKDGYYNFVGATTVEVFTGQVATYDFAMDPNLFGTLDGTVTDSDTGDPLIGAEIYAVSMGGYEYDTVTDNDGYYEITDVVAETYDVTCSFPDYPSTMVEDVLIEDGLTTTVDFSLEGYTFWNDFENNDGGLISDNASGWQWGAFTSGPMAGHSGTNGWGTVIGGNYPSSANFKLDTPMEYMIVSPLAMLEFWHWYDIENSWDGGNVKISTDSGASWSIITPLTGYPGVGNTSNPLTGEDIFCGTLTDYEFVQFDLSPYIGQSIMLRWHFGSDGSVEYPGWYIDDVSISGGGVVDPGWIEGTVTLVGGTGDVTDVVITAGNASTSPAANGDYSLEVFPNTYDVTATLAEYGTFIAEDVVVEEGMTTDLDISMDWIPPTYDPPVNLTVDAMTGLLTWEAPGGAGGEIYHHSGYNDDGIGTNAAVDFICLARFDAVELADFYGSEITSVNIFLHSMDFSYVAIKVYEGGSSGDPGTIVYDQDITASAIALDWTNHVLATPVPLVSGNEYWIGYDLSATADHPAAIDAGPMVPEKGGWLYYNDAWDTLTGLGLDYNWVITGIIGSGSDAIALSNVTKPEKTIASTRSFSSLGGAKFEAEFSRNSSRRVNQVIETTRELESYNVYLGTGLQGNTDDTQWQLAGLVIGQTYTASVEAVYDTGISDPVDITFVYEGTGAGNILPLVTELNGNYPNPFNPETQIKFSIHEQADVTLTVYNVKGQVVKTLINDQLDADHYQVVWNGTDNANKHVSSGVYFYKMKANKFVSTKKMILMK